ncbi:MAG: 50S ribosomal protein L21e [Candidatus Micrarchaeota archaeon]|nr:50S ribosomal protein L21e [Candidatus Micrarchaeota archaeon]
MKRSRGKISKKSRALGAATHTLSVSALVSGYKIGDKVAIDIQSKYSGMPHPRYRGRTGQIVGKQGSAYVVRIKDGKMEKELIIPSVHLKPVKEVV